MTEFGDFVIVFFYKNFLGGGKMGNKHKKRASFVTALTLIINLILNLLSPLIPYAQPQTYAMDSTQTFKVNGQEVSTGSTVQLKPGDNIEYRLDYTINNEEPILKEGDTFTFNLPDIFTNVTPSYPENHFKDMQQNGNQITLVCGPDIETALGGYLTVSATVNQVDYEVPGKIIINFAGQEIVIDTVVVPPGTVDRLIDKQVNGSDNDYIIGADDKGSIVGQEVEYTVVVNEKYTVLENAILTDAIPDGMEYIEGSMAIKEANLNGTEADITPNITSTNPLTVNFGTINKKYIVTYKCKVTEEKERYVNTATISSSNNESKSDSVTAIPAEDTKGADDINKSIVGNSTLTPDDKGSLVGQKVNYKVEVNSNKTQKNNTVFTDAIPEGMKVTKVTISKEVRGKLQDVTSDFTFDMNANPLVIQFGNINNKFIIEYETEITEDKGEYKNTAKLEWDGGSKEVSSIATPTKPTPGTGVISKTANGSKTTTIRPDSQGNLVDKTVDYKIVVNNEMTEKKNLILEDSIPDGMELDLNSVKVTKDVGDNKYIDVTSSVTINKSANKLEVNFGTTSDRYIVEYKTKITENKEEYKNTAKLKWDGDNNPVEDSAIVKPSGVVGVGENDLVKKIVSGGDKDDITITPNNDGTYTDKTINYKIIVNDKFESKKGTILTDDIPAGMVLVKDSVKVEKYDKWGSATDVTNELKITKEDSKLQINFGDIDSKYVVTYKTKITEFKENGWKNNATLVWQGGSAPDDTIVNPTKPTPGTGNLSKTVGGKEEFTIKPDTNGSYVNQTLNYSILVNNEMTEKKNLELTDTMPDGMELLTDTLKVYRDAGNNKYEDITNKGIVTITKDKNGFTVDFKTTSSRYKVEYQTKIVEDKDSYANTVNMNWDGGNTSSTSTVVPNKPQAGTNKLTKKVNGEDEITKKANDNLIGTQYNYTVMVNDKLESKDKVVLTDTMPSGMKLVVGSIKIEKDYGGGVYGDVTKNFKISTTNNSYTINFGNIKDRYRVTYKAEITKIVEAGYRNVATLTSEDGDKEEADANIKVDISEITPGENDNLVKKESNRATISDIGDKVKYTVTINEAKKKLLNLKFEDKMPTGMKLVTNSVKITDTTNNKDVTSKFKDKISATEDKLSIEFGDVYTTTYKVEYEAEVTKLMSKYSNTAKITAQDVKQESKEVLEYKVASGGINATKTVDKTVVEEGKNQDVTYSIKVWSNAIFPADYLKVTDQLDKRVIYKGYEAPDFVEVKYDKDTHTVNIVNTKDIPAASKKDALEIKIKVSFENVKPGEKVDNVAKINETKTPPVTVKKGYIFEGLKVDADNNNSPLAGAKFQLYKVEQRKLFKLIPLEGESLVKVDDGILTSDKNGKITSLKEKDDKTYSVIKEPGTYVLKEIEAPNGYDLLTEEIRFEIKDSDVGTTVDIGSIENTQTTSSVKVTKVDEKYHDKALEGAEFTLSGNGKSYTKTTTSNGVATFDNIKPGTYTLKESKAPEGYTASNEVKTVKVKLGPAKTY